MAVRPRLRRPARQVLPRRATGRAATPAPSALEIVGALPLIVAPQLLRTPIGWDRAPGWGLLSAGLILVFLLLAHSRLDEGDRGDRDRG